MAEDEEGDGAAGLSRRIGPLPLWMWAVGLGGAAGLWIFLRHRASSTDTSTDTSDTDTSSSDDTDADTGYGDGQYQSLYGELQTLQGEVSKLPTGTPTGTTTSTTPPPSSGTGTGTTKPTGGGTTSTTKPPTTTKPKSVLVKVKSGQSFASIAKEYGKSASDLWKYNTTPGVRSASSEATLKKRGESHALYSGSTVYVPAGWKKK